MIYLVLPIELLLFILWIRLLSWEMRDRPKPKPKQKEKILFKAPATYPFDYAGEIIDIYGLEKPY